MCDASHFYWHKSGYLSLDTERFYKIGIYLTTWIRNTGWELLVCRVYFWILNIPINSGSHRLRQQ